MKKQFTTSILLLCCLHFSTAQTSLAGKVTDVETKEELIGANVVVKRNGVFVIGTSTDFNGNFKIDLDPGTYDIFVSTIGYPENQIINILVKPGIENKLDVQLNAGILIDICCFCPFYYDPPLIELDNTTSGLIQTRDNTRKSPFRNTNDLILNTAGVSSAGY